MTQTTMSMGLPAGYIPLEFDDEIDIAECALDEQLEQLQRRYASACRATSRARCEVELLETRADINPHILDQARRQHAAAETRSQQLFRALDALEDRREDSHPEYE
jgi:hypothetical protein